MTELEHLRLAKKRLNRLNKRYEKKIARLGKSARRRIRRRRITYDPTRRDLAPHITFGFIVGALVIFVIVGSALSHHHSSATLNIQGAGSTDSASTSPSPTQSVIYEPSWQSQSGSTPSLNVSATPASTASPIPVPTKLPIPMDTACKWAFPSQATGQITGSGMTIRCLGSDGQVLGGFDDGSGHSLADWCADSSHTDGISLPDAMIDDNTGNWTCTPGR